METQPDVVVAAEAVRTWVLAQRAGWTRPHPATLLVGTPPVVAPAAAPPPPPAVVPVAPPAPPAPPVQVKPTTLPTVADVVPAAVSTALPPAPNPVSVTDRPSIAHVEPDEASTVLAARPRLRAALALAAVAVLAVGGFMLGRRSVGISEPKSGTAVLDSTPAGAAVVIDGRPAGQTPVSLNLPVGTHVVEFTLKAATRRQSVDIAKGQETAVTINWNAKPLGSLRVEARPTPARVVVDGKERGAAPLTLSDLPVGVHTVQIDTAEGSVRRKVEIVEGRTESVTEEIFPGWLQVSSPIEVTVVDGKQAVQLDASNRVLLKPGLHTIRIENRALEISETRQVTIEPGGTARVSLSPAESSLTVTGTPGAEVFVDGIRAGVIPLAAYPVKLGAHDIMVVDTSGATRHASIAVTARPAQLEITFQRP